MTKKPDLVLVLIAVFTAGVLLTAFLPVSADDDVAAPASQLQAGVIVRD